MPLGVRSDLLSDQGPPGTSSPKHRCPASHPGPSHRPAPLSHSSLTLAVPLGHHPPQGPGILASEAPSTSCEKQHSVHVSVVFSTALTSRDLYFLLVLRLLLKHKLCGLGPHWSLSCPHTHVPGTWQDCGPCTSSHRVPWADVAPLLPCPWWAGPTSLLTAMWPGAACHPPGSSCGLALATWIS